MRLVDRVLHPAEVHKVREPHEGEIEAKADDHETQRVHVSDIPHAQDQIEVDCDDQSGEGREGARPQVLRVAHLPVQNRRIGQSEERYVEDHS